MVRRSDEATNIPEPMLAPTWEAFKRTTTGLQPQPDWTRREIPEELRNVIDDVGLPEKLRQILAWSLDVHPASDSAIAGPSTSQTSDNEGFDEAARACGSGKIGNIKLGSGSRPLVSDHKDRLKTSNISPGNVTDDTSPLDALHSEPASRGPRVTSPNSSNSLLAFTFGLIKGKAARQPSAAADAQQAAEENRSMVECTSCFEDTIKNETSKLPCNHSYCRLCLITLITTALQNEASFPPKCCLTAVPLQTILSVLDVKQSNMYKDKAAEFSIPAQNRWYCPNGKCLKWIRPSRLPRIPAWNERCPHCGTKMCSTCRGLAHKSSSDCPQDYGLAATINLAEQEGWCRCLKCRALVERSQGCRHMTCKCGAQFCYTCGKKWRTCSCTETDEVNRQAELRRRREERESARDAEAAEVARIIAQVEELERGNVRQRRLEEERRAEERRREEEELARLEEQRLREEEARRLEDARLEQHLQRTLRLSVEETNEGLQRAWNELRQTQMRSLASRHVDAERQHARALEDAITQQERQNFETMRAMESNIARRTSMMQQKHEAEKEALKKEQQDLEDDMFLEIQMHLRGKQDKEARERRLREQFQNEREGRRQDLVTKHDLETKAFQANAAMEMQSLRWVNRHKMNDVEPKFRFEVDTLMRNVATDRAWFVFVSERRQNMVAAHCRLMIEALEAGQEPVGLTEEISMTIRPLISDVQREAEGTALAQETVSGTVQSQEGESSKQTLSASPASASPTGSFRELATTSQQLLKSLGSDPANLERHTSEVTNNPLVSNTAFAWMTCTEDVGTSPKYVNRATGLTRTRRVSRHDRPRPRLNISPVSPVSPSAPDSSGWMRSGTAQVRHLVPSPSSTDPLTLPVPPLVIHEKEAALTSTSPMNQELRQSSQASSPTSVPGPLAPRQTSHPDLSPTHQARVLGGLIPTTPREEANRLTLLNNLIHRRQTSLATTSSNSSSSSSADSLLMASTRMSPTSHRSSATSRTSADNLSLHSLISAATNTATAAARPSTSTGKAGLSPVSPVSPPAPEKKSFEATGRVLRTRRSIWTVFNEGGK